MRPDRQWIFRILALLPALLLLPAAEWGLRWHRAPFIDPFDEEASFWQASLRIHEKSADPELVYELVPGSEATREGVRVRINSHGFRDDEFPHRAAGRRIVVLGDSVAWGWGVPMEQAFPQVAERRLAARTPPGDASPTLYNLAVDGYSTAQEIRLLETRALTFRPHMVVINYVLNDPDTLDGGLARYFGSPSRSELLYTASRALWRLGLVLRGYSRSDPQLDYHHFIFVYYRDRIEAQFRRLGEISREQRLPIAVLLLPVFDFAPGKGYPWHDLHDVIATLCENNGLDVVDLYPAFEERSSADVSLDLWHPNVEGHAMIAEALVRYLEENM